MVVVWRRAEDGGSEMRGGKRRRRARTSTRRRGWKGRGRGGGRGGGRGEGGRGRGTGGGGRSKSKAQKMKVGGGVGVGVSLTKWTLECLDSFVSTYLHIAGFPAVAQSICAPNWDGLRYRRRQRQRQRQYEREEQSPLKMQMGALIWMGRTQGSHSGIRSFRVAKGSPSAPTLAEGCGYDICQFGRTYLPRWCSR